MVVITGLNEIVSQSVKTKISAFNVQAISVVKTLRNLNESEGGSVYVFTSKEFA